MADHGEIAHYPATYLPTMVVQVQPVLPLVPRCIRTVHAEPSAERLALNAGRDNAEGTSTPPSLYLPHGGLIRLRIPVAAGSRAVTVKARQPSVLLLRPTARLLPNAAIGLNVDVSATAPAGPGWVSIGPLTFTATANGGVFVELFAPWSGGESGCWFDALTVA